MGVAPSTKWTTKHHYKDPVLEMLTNDDWIEPIGVVVYGSSDGNNEKIFNSFRTAKIVEVINPDGCVVEVDGFGNNHVDWINLIDEIGKIKVPFVGIGFKGINSFVVKSKYLTDNFIDTDYGKLDYESCVVGQNSVTIEKAQEAIKKLKLDMITKKGKKYETK